MSFGTAIRTVLGRYTDFTGRADRPELWWWLLFVTLVAGALELFTVIPLGEGSVGTLLLGLWRHPAQHEGRRSPARGRRPSAF